MMRQTAAFAQAFRREKVCGAVSCEARRSPLSPQPTTPTGVRPTMKRRTFNVALVRAANFPAQ
jgi:hypothetical protein